MGALHRCRPHCEIIVSQVAPHVPWEETMTSLRLDLGNLTRSHLLVQLEGVWQSNR
jgi:hypothetical protein